MLYDQRLAGQRVTEAGRGELHTGARCKQRGLLSWFFRRWAPDEVGIENIWRTFSHRRFAATSECDLPLPIFISPLPN